MKEMNGMSILFDNLVKQAKYAADIKHLRVTLFQSLNNIDSVIYTLLYIQ